MIHLIQFEVNKFFKKKKNLIVIGILFLISITFVILNIKTDIYINKSKISSNEFNIESIESSLLQVDNEISKFPDNDKLKLIKKLYEDEFNLLQRQKIAIKNNDWVKELECQIQIDKNSLKNIEDGTTISPFSTSELKENIYLNETLIEKNIEPINESTSMKAFNFLKVFLNSPLMLILIIAIITFTSDIVSSEVEYKTCNLLFTQPIYKTKILLSKLIAAILTTIFILLSTVFSLFIVLGLTKGFGSIDYPTKFLSNNNMSYITSGEFLLYLITSFIILIIFIVTLSIFISSLCNQSLTSFSITVILVTTVYMLIDKGLFKKISHLIPFTYISLASVGQGYLANNLNNTNVNLLYGLGVLMFFTAIIIPLNLIYFKMKRIK